MEHEPPRTIKSADHAFDKRLRLAVEQIRRDAGGRTCGTCAHSRGTWCSTQLNLDGQPLEIIYEGAPACSGFAVTAS